MSITPRPLILNLLLGAGGDALSARDAVAACALLGIQENSARVALARLTAGGFLSASGRGTYTLGPAAQPLAEEVSTWRSASVPVRDWNGDWIAVHTGGLGRGDRVALRARERAFGLLGLAEFERGLFLRPDNLSGGVGAVRERLSRLMPHAGFTVFVARAFDSARDETARALWDGLALNNRYRTQANTLDSWEASRLPLENAARESFVRGNNAIRERVFDPLLPEPMVDTAARDNFFAAVRRFDAVGQAIWQTFLCGVRSRAPQTRARPTHLLQTTP
jgi:phenylacetic acid degradation operon negative regulatory protein